MSDKAIGVPWLVKIRWAAVVGQLLVFVVATWGIGLTVDVLPFFVVSALITITNCALSLSAVQRWFLRTGTLGVVVICDVLLLTTLLYFYGGHTNPFGMVYLVHVVIAALLLGSWWTWGISILCSVCYAALFRWYVPVHELSGGHHAAASSDFDLHLQGMLLGFVLIAMLISGFLQRMRAEIDWRESELSRRRANEEKLAAVTTVAASVAHELGTPLGSMMLVLDDVTSVLQEQRALVPVSADLELMRQQLERCSSAVTRLVQSSGQLFGETPALVNLDELLQAVKAQFRSELGQRIQVEGAGQRQAVVLPREGLQHVIFSLVKNAFEASDNAAVVRVVVTQSPSQLRLSIIDHGAGMSAEQIGRVGDPFFTTKDSSRGMGLGLFVSKLFVERLGGRFHVVSSLGRGTEVNIELPTVLNWQEAA